MLMHNVSTLALLVRLGLAADLMELACTVSDDSRLVLLLLLLFLLLLLLLLIALSYFSSYSEKTRKMPPLMLRPSARPWEDRQGVDPEAGNVSMAIQHNRSLGRYHHGGRRFVQNSDSLATF